MSALAERGVDAIAAVWDSYDDWPSVAACVVRSTWDYTERVEEFLAWVDRVSESTPLWNPPTVLRWNAHKSYLRSLAAAGVDVVPTRWIGAGSATRLVALMEDEGWREAVVKPVVSAGAHNTARVTRADAEAAERAADALAADRDMMIQPYQRSVEARGELSLVFIDGGFSHAVRKLPAAGDFRTQLRHGARFEAAAPETAELEIAAHALACAPSATLYGRVDLVTLDDGRPAVMELEVLEPSLYLTHAPPAATERLADAIVARL